jgi:predicted DNA binding CopG/RHH family protein
MNRRQLKLDEEELQILGDFERGEFESIQNFREEKRRLEAAARRTLQKDKRINVRLSSRDLEKIQKRAATERIPYQPVMKQASPRRMK